MLLEASQGVPWNVVIGSQPLPLSQDSLANLLHPRITWNLTPASRTGQCTEEPPQKAWREERQGRREERLCVSCLFLFLRSPGRTQNWENHRKAPKSQKPRCRAQRSCKTQSLQKTKLRCLQGVSDSKQRVSERLRVRSGVPIFPQSSLRRVAASLPPELSPSTHPSSVSKVLAREIPVNKLKGRISLKGH